MPPPPRLFTQRNGRGGAGGEELVSWSRQRFVRECGGQERVGNLMYEGLRMQLKAARKLCPAGADAILSNGRRSIFAVTPPKPLKDKRKPTAKSAAQRAADLARLSEQVHSCCC